MAIEVAETAVPEENGVDVDAVDALVVLEEEEEDGESVGPRSWTSVAFVAIFGEANNSWPAGELEGFEVVADAITDVEE